MSRVDILLERVGQGERLSPEQYLTLYLEADLLVLGQAANMVRRRWHKENVITFVIDRNINYTNVCQCGCRFCAFYRRTGDADAYVITENELLQKIAETIQVGGTGVLIQGGLHPDLDLTFFERMLRTIKEHFPGIHVHSFSPPEIAYLAEKSNMDYKQVLARLQRAGLDSLPGGGAEILVDRVRKLISPRKASARVWLDVMRAAHELGMRTTATMMFGHVETPAERIEHMLKIRDLQDETGGFTAFIPWTFQPGRTALGGEPVTAVEYLRLLAISRLVLDNVPNLQVSWVTQGAKVAQVALSFGANDFGSTMLEENVVRAAGVDYRVPMEEIVRCIQDAGFTAVQRTNLYQTVRTF
ncbi:MAG: cyclic dehypoxanthinyl futalosine synthase [Bacillota bacterium]|uniref:cyclic dehypoxanthinyl futalosine synthase n=1 Tax=Desulfurispora thermophila TaxID=265470 RepID=UPI00037EB505|nr:cyclic dehypoxanthinyl futalosine synthase [Desulfurispora thermophila]